MFHKILCPTDLSEYASAMVACLPELKAAGLRHVVLLHAINPRWLAVNGVGSNLREALHNEAMRALTAAQADLASADITADVIIEVGPPAQVILAVADAQDVDAIVIGAHGRSHLEEFLLGGEVAKVVRTSRRPVLVQRFELLRSLDLVECKRLCAQTFQRVLYPTDFSDHAQAAQETIKALHGVVEEVIVLHVQDERAMRHRSAEQLAEFDRIDRERLEAICADLAAAGIRARARLEHGVPFERITATTGEEGASSIVIGSRGRSAIAEWLLGSVAENVIRHASVPVLVVHRKEKLA